MLSLDTMKEVCQVGNGNKQCRYLYEDKPYCFCMKLLPEYKEIIDKEVNLCRKQKYKGLAVPLGDNCPGVKNPEAVPVLKDLYDLN